jgi:deazaflavin-dependent oxidoreductase (nitroreductase family)
MVYLRPGWLQRKLEPMFMTRLPNQPYIRVRGRTTGQLRSIPVRPLKVGDSWYLVSLPGNSNWARNLRATASAELVEKGDTRSITVTEVFGDEQAAAVAGYLASSTYRPTIKLLSERLPNPEDHPVFRID